MTRQYLIVLTAAARRTSPTTFACESAFVEHLRTLRGLLADRFDEVVVAMGEMSDAHHQQWKSGMSVVDEAKEGIRFEPVFPWRASGSKFLLQSPRTVARLAKLVGDATLVHSHLSIDLYRPIELTASILGKLMNKKVIAITDLDGRRDAEMNYKLGRWSRRAYLMCKYIYDPLRDVQQRAYVKTLDLVLFKEPQQVEDYGKGAPHVRLFFDPNFSQEHVITDDDIADRERALREPSSPLRVLYFGRLVPYKGVDRMLQAVASARRQGAHLTFDVMGAGEEEHNLKRLARDLGLDDIVRWIEPRPYGDAFFDVLRARDLLLACPLSADTPRSTWDAFASGLPILAFDSPFYAGIGKHTGAVDVTPWPDVEPFARRLVALANDKTLVVERMKNAVKAARENPGEEWLKRRVRWVEELFDEPAAARRAVTHPSESA